MPKSGINPAQSDRADLVRLARAVPLIDPKANPEGASASMP